jgi:hypothetical protein
LSATFGKRGRPIFFLLFPSFSARYCEVCGARDAPLLFLRARGCLYGARQGAQGAHRARARRSRL